MKGLYNNPALIQDRIRPFEGVWLWKGDRSKPKIQNICHLFSSYQHGIVTFLKTHLAWIWRSYILTEAALLSMSKLNTFCGVLRCLVLNDPNAVNNFKVYFLRATSLVLNLSNDNCFCLDSAVRASTSTCTSESRQHYICKNNDICVRIISMNSCFLIFVEYYKVVQNLFYLLYLPHFQSFFW